MDAFTSRIVFSRAAKNESSVLFASRRKGRNAVGSLCRSMVAGVCSGFQVSGEELFHRQLRVLRPRADDDVDVHTQCPSAAIAGFITKPPVKYSTFPLRSAAAKELFHRLQFHPQRFRAIQQSRFAGLPVSRSPASAFPKASVGAAAHSSHSTASPSRRSGSVSGWHFFLLWQKVTQRHAASATRWLEWVK